jgi:alanine racemase
MRFLQTLKNFFRPKYEPLNIIEIYQDNLLDNLKLLQNKQAYSEIFPVLKANAYSHGLKEVAQILKKTNVPLVAVDSFPEAQVLYDYTKKDVLILGECADNQYKYFNFKRTEFCVYNEKTLIRLAKFKKNIKVHLFVNTGMNREGIQDLSKFLKNTKKYLPYIKITGFCSHFASSETDSELNFKQKEKFFNLLRILNKEKIYPKWVHLGNSSAIFKEKDERFTAFRSGLAFYGYHTFSLGSKYFKAAEELKPALRVLSQVVSLQDLKAGDTISYNETFKTNNNMRVGVVPFGYSEGLDRVFSAKAVFYNLKHKTYLPVCGKICMNLSVFDTKDFDINLGDRIEIIGLDKNKKNNIYEYAKIKETNPYEILTSLNDNIRRIIV